MVEVNGICYAEYPPKPLLRVRSVRPLDNYKLLLTFTNDEKKIFDMTPYLEFKAFIPIKEPSVFFSVYVDHGTIVWDDDLDFDPDTLYTQSSIYEKTPE